MYNENEYEAFAQQMHEKYPKMFKEPYGGFAVGPGWWPILKALCGQIHNYVEWKQNQLEKYKQGNGCPDVIVRQIKEKFGGLRFYYDGGDAEVSGMVRMAEAWADNTCEECGKPGKSRNTGWIKTLCDEHEEQRQARYKERFGK